ncbi:hypothetical protein VIGAN_07180900 [Vigna angularis var. angularis]|uniref:Uncharacterized protein n=1 Tax=Vigna angularis var. angularis TaxID=157739 RepID=A0A0S3SJG2_PHAAN|nr:hypothetical protein VIGAN_07180900 [Vigna angularis var. angularis]
MVRFCFSVGVLFPKVQTFAVVLFPCYIVQFSYILCCQRAWWCCLGVLCCGLGPIFFVSATWMLTSHFLLEV